MKITATWLFAPILSVAAAAGACSSDPAEGPAPPGVPAPDASTGLAPVAVQILAINDFHGNLEPPTGGGGLVTVPLTNELLDAGAESGVVLRVDAGQAQIPAGGAAYLAAHVKQLRTANPYTVVVSAGDLTGASPLLSSLFRDEPSVLAMNLLGLDVEGVGNHDFDRGLPELLRLQGGGCHPDDCDAGAPPFAGAKFSYLAANVTSERSMMTVFPPYVVKEFGGVKVGIIGMTLEKTPSVVVASAIEGLSFANEVATVNALVPALEREGVSTVVVVVHQGGFQAVSGTVDSCDDLTGDVLPLVGSEADAGRPVLHPKVDVIVSGHTHQAYNCTIGGRIVTSAASFGRVVTKIDLEIDPVSRRVISKRAVNVPVTRDVAPDPDVAGLVAEYQTRAAPRANRVIGHVAANITKDPAVAGSPSCETPLGNLIADAQRSATESAATGGAVVAFMNPGGIRADIVAQGPNKAPGSVTYGEVFTVQPFANNLVTMTLTGDQILRVLRAQFGSRGPRILQVSGISYEYTWDAAQKIGTILENTVQIGGVALDRNATYRVTANIFIAEGGDEFSAFKEGTDRRTGLVDLDALVGYFEAHSSAANPLPVPALGRIRGNACQ